MVIFLHSGYIYVYTWLVQQHDHCSFTCTVADQMYDWCDSMIIVGSLADQMWARQKNSNAKQAGRKMWKKSKCFSCTVYKKQKSMQLSETETNFAVSKTNKIFTFTSLLLQYAINPPIPPHLKESLPLYTSLSIYNFIFLCQSSTILFYNHSLKNKVIHQPLSHPFHSQFNNLSLSIPHNPVLQSLNKELGNTSTIQPSVPFIVQPSFFINPTQSHSIITHSRTR